MGKILICSNFEKLKIDYDEIVEVDELKVDDVKLIKNIAYQTYEKSITLLIKAKKYNVFAQNALLKILEEPPKGVEFILVARSKNSLLDTIKSRLIVEVLDCENIHDIDIDLNNIDNKKILEVIDKISKDDFQLFLKKILYTKSLNEELLSIISRSIEMVELNIDFEAILLFLMSKLKEKNEDL